MRPDSPDAPLVSAIRPHDIKESTPGNPVRLVTAAEGLRGLAAANVFFSHFLISFFPAAFLSLYPREQAAAIPVRPIERILAFPLLSVFYNGFFPVVLFFVLSGYVLTLPVFTGGGPSVLHRRFMKRYLRLGFPAAIAILLGYVLQRTHFNWNAEVCSITRSDWIPQYWRSEPKFVDALRDMLFGCLVEGQNRFDIPLWTMQVELIGSYLIFVAYIVLPNPAKWLPNTLFFVMLSYLFFHGVVFIGYILCFWAGSLMPLIRKCPREWLYLPLLAAGLYLAAYDGSAMFGLLRRLRSSKRMYDMVGAVLLVYVAINSRLVGRVLSAPFLRFLGRISFSLYLTHLLVLFTFTYWFFQRFHGAVGSSILIPVDLILTTGVACLVAVLFHRFVDRVGVGLSDFFAGLFK